MVSPASAGTLSAPRRRVSQSCTVTAAANIDGAAIAANHSCAAMSPPARPSHDAPPLSRCAIRNAAANGNRRRARSGRTHLQLSGIRVSTSRVATFGVGVAEALKFDVFFDYLCPFVYRASELLGAVQRSGRRDIEVRWRYFSLTQVNSKDDGWTVWSAPASEAVRGSLAFAAAEASRRQGRFEGFHLALLAARHGEHLDIDDRDVVEKVARGQALDMKQFGSDMADPAILGVLASDHT